MFYKNISSPAATVDPCGEVAWLMTSLLHILAEIQIDPQVILAMPKIVVIHSHIDLQTGCHGRLAL